MTALIEALGQPRAVLLPGVLLTPDGPVGDHALVVEGARIVSVGPATALSAEDATRALRLPEHAIFPASPTRTRTWPRRSARS